MNVWLCQGVRRPVACYFEPARPCFFAIATGARRFYDQGLGFALSVCVNTR
jgi:hypothetical protein